MHKFIIAVLYKLLDMKKKLLLLSLVVSFILILPNVNATSSFLSISSSEAKQIKQEFLDLEHNFTGAEKISRQLQIIRGIGAISNSTFDFLTKVIDSLNHSGFISPYSNKQSLFLGPTIVSHFTLNGRIQSILPMRRILFYFPLIKTENISGVSGILPYYFGKTNNAIYLTCIGYLYKGSFDKNYTCLKELMAPTIGFSIAFYDNSTSKVLFEYNIDYCHLAIIKGEK